MSNSASLNAPSRRVTLDAIAKDARVSASTVSKVLNGRAGVSEQTRRLVEEKLAASGYIPRAAPDASRVIEVVFYELSTEWILEALQGIDEVAREMDCTIMLTKSHDLLDPERGWAEQVSRRRPLGVILLFSSISAVDMRRLRSRRIPFVVVDPAREPGLDVPYVGAQNWAGGVAAAQHLIDLGHRSIAAITGPEQQLCARARLSGFRFALEMAGVEYRPEFVKWGTFHPEAGRELGLELLRLPDRPTAIFAGADQQAAGVYQAAGELGLRIPQDLSVLGFDDLPIAQLIWPALSTIRQPIREMARMAARIITQPADADHQQLELATELVVRGSTAPPPAAA